MNNVSDDTYGHEHETGPYTAVAVMRFCLLFSFFLAMMLMVLALLTQRSIVDTAEEVVLVVFIQCLFYCAAKSATHRSHN